MSHHLPVPNLDQLGTDESGVACHAEDAMLSASMNASTSQTGSAWKTEVVTSRTARLAMPRRRWLGNTHQDMWAVASSRKRTSQPPRRVRVPRSRIAQVRREPPSRPAASPATMCAPTRSRVDRCGYHPKRRACSSPSPAQCASPSASVSVSSSTWPSVKTGRSARAGAPGRPRAPGCAADPAYGRARLRASAARALTRVADLATQAVVIGARRQARSIPGRTGLHDDACQPGVYQGSAGRRRRQRASAAHRSPTPAASSAARSEGSRNAGPLRDLVPTPSAFVPHGWSLMLASSPE